MHDEPFEALFSRWIFEHGGIVRKVARAYTHTTEDGQDLAQEILLQVWRSLPRFQSRASAPTWIYRVALNTALSWRRKEQRRRPSEEPVVDVESLRHTRSDDSLQAAEPDVVERLYAAIRQLPKTDAALVLLYLEGLTYLQMAEVLGITAGNVGVKLTRAKKALRDRLKRDSHDD